MITLASDKLRLVFKGASHYLKSIGLIPALVPAVAVGVLEVTITLSRERIDVPGLLLTGAAPLVRYAVKVQEVPWLRI